MEIKLTKSEQIVLFEFLANYNEDKNKIVYDKSEEIVLNNLECVLEGILEEPFLENYNEILDKAREEVKKG